MVAFFRGYFDVVGRNDLESRLGILEMEKSMLTQSSNKLKTEMSEQKTKMESLSNVQTESDRLKEKVSSKNSKKII